MLLISSLLVALLGLLSFNIYRKANSTEDAFLNRLGQFVPDKYEWPDPLSLTEVEEVNMALLTSDATDVPAAFRLILRLLDTVEDLEADYGIQERAHKDEVKLLTGVLKRRNELLDSIMEERTTVFTAVSTAKQAVAELQDDLDKAGDYFIKAMMEAPSTTHQAGITADALEDLDTLVGQTNREGDVLNQADADFWAMHDSLSQAERGEIDSILPLQTWEDDLLDSLDSDLNDFNFWPMV